MRLWVKVHCPLEGKFSEVAQEAGLAWASLQPSALPWEVSYVPVHRHAYKLCLCCMETLRKTFDPSGDVSCLGFIVEG